MRNISIKSQNLMIILFLLLINILAFMSVDTTDNVWIILFASSVFFMDFVIITMLIMFLSSILVVSGRGFNFLRRSSTELYPLMEFIIIL